MGLLALRILFSIFRNGKVFFFSCFVISSLFLNGPRISWVFPFWVILNMSEVWVANINCSRLTRDINEYCRFRSMFALPSTIVDILFIHQVSLIWNEVFELRPEWNAVNGSISFGSNFNVSLEMEFFVRCTLFKVYRLLYFERIFSPINRDQQMEFVSRPHVNVNAKTKLIAIFRFVRNDNKKKKKEHLRFPKMHAHLLNWCSVLHRFAIPIRYSTLKKICTGNTFWVCEQWI